MGPIREKDLLNTVKTKEDRDEELEAFFGQYAKWVGNVTS